MDAGMAPNECRIPPEQMPGSLRTNAGNPPNRRRNGVGNRLVGRGFSLSESMNPSNWKNKGGKATPLGEGHREARCAFYGEEMEGRRGMPVAGRTYIPGAPMNGW